jgi:O-6-methylguanine DNA methyltransferase
MTIEQKLERLMGEAVPDRMSDSIALGTGLADGYNTYQTQVGEVVVTFNPEGVSSVSLASDDYEAYFQDRFGRALIPAEAPRAWGHLISERIEAGSPGKLPVDLRSVTPFQSKVLLTAARIPRGEVRPYGWLARQVANDRAVRAVGSTMARNPIPLIIPCHRVVRSDGHIGAYSLGGPEQKWLLLAHEGARPETLEELARRHVRVQGNVATGVYCLPTCRAIRRSKPENVVAFSSTSEAEGEGFRSCQLCQPA